MEDIKKQIKSLIEKAANAKESNDALKFSQAAVNSANALCAMNVSSMSE